MAENEPKKKKTSRFGTTNANEKQDILDKRKKPNTNRATKLWFTCFTDYLREKELPEVKDITNEDLPNILEQFYSEVRKKEAKENPKNEAAVEGDRLYKNTSLKAIRGALARYFKEARCIDIISNEKFLRANQVFEGVQRINKEKGLGSIISKPPIDDSDLHRITEYFKAGMSGPPNPQLLQQCVLFYIVLYMCRRGRENLRDMTKDTFKLTKDAEDGRMYIFQAVDEADKNHSHKDTTNSNDGRIYEVPGKYTESLFCIFYLNALPIS